MFHKVGFKSIDKIKYIFSRLDANKGISFYVNILFLYFKLHYLTFRYNYTLVIAVTLI